MKIAVWAVNLLGWPVIHLVIARLALSLPRDRFGADNFVTRERSWEDGGRFYRRWCAIRKWKELLPDGAPWLGGLAKKRFTSLDREYLRVFLLETRRAEIAHWWMLCCTPLFFFWNPPWAWFVMVTYGISANMPCILAQRYNRAILSRRVRVERGSNGIASHARI